jgi:hypothetical protein
VRITDIGCTYGIRKIFVFLSAESADKYRDWNQVHWPNFMSGYPPSLQAKDEIIIFNISASLSLHASGIDTITVSVYLLVSVKRLT